MVLKVGSSKKVENRKNLFLLMKKKEKKIILKIMNSRKKMRKSVKSKENGDYITHMCYNWIVGVFFFFNMCILLSGKSIPFGSSTSI